MKNIILLFALFPVIFISAQSNFNFYIDYASFKYDSSSNYIEFYYSFSSSQLKAVSIDNGLQVEGLFRLEIKNDSTGKDIVNNEWKIPYYVKDTSAISSSKNLVGIIRFVVPEGKYTCNAEGSDFNNTSLKKSYEFLINEKPFGAEHMTVSGIQLASNIKQASSDTSSIFYKSTLEVTPMPSGIFGENSPVLFYYGELYNLDKVADLSAVKFESLVYDTRGNEVYSHIITSLKPIPASVEAGVINVSKYISGKYYLVLSLSNGSSQNSIISRKEFYVYNPSVNDTAYDVSANIDKTLSSQFAFLSSEECDDIFAKSEYIASKNERDQYKKIQRVGGKREFLYKFWKQKANENDEDKRYSYTDYMNRVKIANEKYRNFAKKGWESDMGRVYIVYGKPSDIERHPNESNKKPYEIWFYNNIEGGVEFIFGDLTGFNNYVLLTSTKRGEVEDNYWLQRLTTTN